MLCFSLSLSLFLFALSLLRYSLSLFLLTDHIVELDAKLKAQRIKLLLGCVCFL